MTNNKIKTKRSFGGKIDNFETKEERNFQKKHLRAYLKGNSHFRHGFDLKGKPIFFKTIEIWK